jgi:hypothetical protein
MGGKALQPYGVKTERKTTKDFNRIALEIQNQMVRDIEATSTVVKCYHNKETHGDLDLLILVDRALHERNVNFRTYIQDTFNPTAIHTNGGVTSFDYENFQVDFIPVKESNWEIAQVYFSYDPLGNAMGKTFHKMNLSYGWDGLKFKYRNFNGRNSHDILISKDPRKIFEFGGYDYDLYLKGFNKMEEIFEFIISCKYFNVDVFKMENLNHIDRKRNRKRVSYHQFLEYIEKFNIKSRYIFKDKLFYSQIINDYFPEANFFEKLEELDRKNAINAALHDKLNGKLIMEWIPGLEGKALGDVIREFKSFHGSTYEETVLGQSAEELRDYFINYYENIYGKK